MRTFLAIGLPGKAVRAIGKLQAQLPVGRAVPCDNLHMTLVFLDEQEDERLGALHEELLHLRSDPFDLELAGLGVFGGRSPKVLFVGVPPVPALIELHRKVEAAARRAGIDLGHARYRPHVTLARFGRHGLDRSGAARLAGFLETHAGFSVSPFAVERFTLFRSTLRPEGAQHEELASYDISTDPHG